ncbi:MAG: hypothetical protein FWH06_06375 [Oscillospiraceae bacterium]|nr:hypothetical protein [Oscillospiraceae bacterium]
MNQRQTSILATAAAAGTALLLLLFFIIFISGGRQPVEIKLPPDMSGHGAPETAWPPFAGAPSPQASGELEITRENVRTIVADLARLSGYKAVCSLDVYAGGSSYTKTQRLTVLDGYQKTEYLGGDGELVRTEVMGPAITFFWDATPGSALNSLATGGFSGDASAFMPTYEDVLSLEAGDISEAGYEVVDGKPCVNIRAAWPDGETGYDVEYMVDMATGLLISARAYRNGSPVWAFEMSVLENARVSSADFVLPGGATAMERQE